MSVRSNAWAMFDALIDRAPEARTNPWRTPPNDLRPEFVVDYDTLRKLLAVPIALGANSQSGVPALAFDVWAAYEFRRAGFDPDAVWPRPVAPRVLPPEISALLAAVPKPLRAQLLDRIEKGNVRGIGNASATVLGKNYVKQVDSGMSSWRTGPELLVSTKRMDSSFGKNAANRVEESYGDAKNLRLRHPRAALGFVYGLRSTALTEEPDKTEWLCDLLAKLGQEDDAYDAVALIIPEWGGATAPAGDDDPADDALIAAGLQPENPDPRASLPLEQSSDSPTPITIDALPQVTLRHDAVPDELRPERFFAIMTRRVLANCPVNFHTDARAKLKDASKTP